MCQIYRNKTVVKYKIIVLTINTITILLTYDIDSTKIEMQRNVELR